MRILGEEWFSLGEDEKHVFLATNARIKLFESVKSNLLKNYVAMWFKKNKPHSYIELQDCKNNLIGAFVAPKKAAKSMAASFKSVML